MKMCVLRLSSLGDVVLITPILRELRARFPDSHISTVVKDEYAPVLYHNPNVDRLRVMYTDGIHSGMNGIMRFVRELRRQEFDLFIDLHRNLRSRLITSRVRAKQRTWYHKRRWRRWAMVHTKWFHIEPRHTIDLYFDCVKSLGIEPRDRRPEIFLTDDEIIWAKTYLKDRGVTDNKNLVGIHIGAKGEAKRWFPERFARIADELSELGWTPILLGGDGDQPFLEEICQAALHRPVILHQRSLRELIALIDRCSLFLCHDSGPMHVAVARHIPVVALFGPTHPRLGFWPLGEHDTVLSADVECSPCSLHGTRRCRMKEKECMEQISEGRVFETVLHVLNEKREKVEIGA